MLLITPETGRLPEKMGGLAGSISGKSGGLGEVIAALCGATATNRDTGGYHDKIEELSLLTGGATQDRGNGFLFRDYDTGGLWYGLARSVAFHRRPLEIRETQLRRIMRETEEKHSLERMIDGYMAIYERIGGGVPLIP